MRLVKETSISGRTPEELLTNLEIQIAIYRSRSRVSNQKRILVLTFGMLFILIATSAALFMLQQQIPDRPEQHRKASETATTDHP